jgi:DNA-binding CsgD family transcriptional regulator
MLEAAYQAYVDAGAQRDTARVRSALRGLGIRKRSAAMARPGHGWGSLTRAELAVIQIVAEGRTNRETAAQLYLSADTVNTHLRHAFAKLQIRSRVELARLVLARQ